MLVYILMLLWFQQKITIKGGVLKFVIYSNYSFYYFAQIFYWNDIETKIGWSFIVFTLYKRNKIFYFLLYINVV